MVADVWRRALMAGQDGGCLGTQALTPRLQAGVMWLLRTLNGLSSDWNNVYFFFGGGRVRQQLGYNYFTNGCVCRIGKKL